MKRLVAFTLSLSIASPLMAATPSSLALGQEITRLSQQGATGLAEFLMDQTEPDRVAQPLVWQQWQRDKIAVLMQRGEWAEVIREFEAQLDVHDTPELRWLKLQAIQAYINQGQGEQARDLLLPMLWNEQPSAAEVTELRRLVVHSYLVDGRVDNARTAARRYELDHAGAEADSAWLALKARSLIAQGQSNDAAILAVVDDQPPVKAAYTLALMTGLTALDESLWKDGLHWLTQPGMDQQFRQAMSDALFNKAKQVSAWSSRIHYLQQLLALGAKDSAQQVALVDALWFAYREYGQQIANQQQLLIGNFDPWFELAAQIQAEQSTQSEALYAWLALNSNAPAVSDRAHDLFVMSLMSEGRAYAVRPLYLSATQFSDSKLPTVLTYRLVDLALAEAELAQASKLMSQLEAPEGLNVIEWQLRRARLQILTGVSNYGIELLQQVVAAESLNQAQLQYLILATHDLKQKAKYDEAYTILAQLLNRAPQASMNQQLLFWMADARELEQRYTVAARLYLQAAAQSQDSQSEWSMAALQRAAEVLQLADQPGDALRLYEQLWLVASGSQRLMFQVEIQRLKSR